MNVLMHFDPGAPVSRLALVVMAEITALVAVAGIVSLGCRRRAAARHAVWLWALVWVLLSPLVAVLASRTEIRLWSVPLAVEERVPEPSAPLQPDRDAFVMPEPVPAAPGVAVTTADHPPLVESTAAVPVAPAPPSGDPWAGGLWLLWGTGVALGLARLGAGWRRLARLARTGRALDPERYGAVLAQVRGVLGLESLPAVECSSLVAGPIAVGLRRPRVILPERLPETLSADALRDVLVHECAHILRRDAWIGLLQRVAGILFWPHPLVHYLNGQLSRAREEVCDNHVLRAHDACGYARTLLTLTERCAAAGSHRLGLGLLGSRWTLADRVAGLLDPGRVALTRTTARLKIVSAVLLCAPGVLVSLVQVESRARAAQSPPADNLAGVGGRRIQGIVVDEQGDPVAGALVRLVQYEEGTWSAADGSFDLTLVGEFPRRSEELTAEAESGARMGVARYDEPQDIRAGTPVRIVLKPSRTVTVRVRDSADVPVPGAEVEVFDDDVYFRTKERTGADGVARLHVPVDVRRPAWVLGFKAGVGCDYFENYDRWPPVEDRPLPEEVTLTLNGAQTVRATFLDTAGRPLAGLAVTPGGIAKKGKRWGIIPVMGTTTWTVTDAAGVAVFDWIPKDVGPRLAFRTRRRMPRVNGSPLVSLGPILRSQPPGPAERTYRVPVATRLSGTVRFPDGRPAPGVLVQAEGHPLNAVGSAMYARTGDDGSYAIHVEPGLVYLVAVRDGTWAASSHTTGVVQDGKSQEGIDLTLVRGTLLHGRITQRPGREPAAGQEIALVMQGDRLPKNLATMERDRAKLYAWARTDEDGRYRFRVTPGHYTLVGAVTLAQAKPGPIAVEVKDEAEIVRDVALANSPLIRPLRGLVVERTSAGDRPVAGARIQLVNVGRPANSGNCLANDRGEFVIERLAVELAACAQDGRGYAGFVRLGPKDERVTIVVAPAAELTGRLLDPSGKPYERRRVLVNLKLAPSSDRPVERVLATVTDDAGRFTIRGVPVGSEGEVNAYHGGTPINPVHTLMMFRVPSADRIELPDLIVPPPGPPHIVR